MVYVNDCGRIRQVDNHDPKVARITGSEQRYIEELTGKHVSEMSSDSVESKCRFINGE